MGTGQKTPTRHRRALSNFPGPGTYPVKSFMGEGPHIALKARLAAELNHSMLVPGPGTYEPNLSLISESPRTIHMSTSGKRSPEGGKLQQVPGPGTYKLDAAANRGPRFGFGKGQRSSQKPDPYPGPGNYQIPTTVGSLPGYEKSAKV